MGDNLVNEEIVREVSLERIRSDYLDNFLLFLTFFLIHTNVLPPPPIYKMVYQINERESELRKKLVKH